MYFIKHCFICHSSVLEDAGIEPRTIASLALTISRSNRSARSHPHSARSHPQLGLIGSTKSARSHPQLGQISYTNWTRSNPHWLDLIPIRRDLSHIRLDLIYIQLDLTPIRLDLIPIRLDLIHTRPDLLRYLDQISSLFGQISSTLGQISSTISARSRSPDNVTCKCKIILCWDPGTSDRVVCTLSLFQTSTCEYSPMERCSTVSGKHLVWKILKKIKFPAIFSSV